jgi:hypothetical protein
VREEAIARASAGEKITREGARLLTEHHRETGAMIPRSTTLADEKRAERNQALSASLKAAGSVVNDLERLTIERERASRVIHCIEFLGDPPMDAIKIAQQEAGNAGETGASAAG